MSGRLWTEAENRELSSRYPNEPTYKIASDMNRSERSVYARAYGLGLKKSDAYLASPDAGRIRPGSKRGGAHRFKKGHKTWNKGTHWKAGGRSAKTRFKKGHLSGRALEQLQPVGAERVTKDGIRQRKIKSDGQPHRRWKSIHQIVWESENGPVPKGHLVVFKNGDRSDIHIENLELITRSENMRRNSYLTRYPKEVADVIRLRGALNRKINNRSKQHEKQHQ